MNIQHEDDGKTGRFFIAGDNGSGDLAEMVYLWRGESQVAIEHTEVDPSQEGKGVGKALVAAGAAFAREKGITIIARCSFARKVMEHNPDYADVLAKS